MANLTKDTPRTFQLGDLNHHPVSASAKIYEGAAVTVDATGLAHNCVGTEKFVGFALAQADNSSGSAGDVKVQVQVKGCVKIPVTGATAASQGVKVYASDGDTFTTTSTSNAYIGVIRTFLASTVCIVAFDADGVNM